MAETIAQLKARAAKFVADRHNNLNAAQKASLAKLNARIAKAEAKATGPVVTPPIPAAPTAAPITDPEVIWAKLLDAEDVVLKAAGKPAGRDGAERGSVTRDEAIAIVNGLGIPNALAILAERGYSFGPEPEPGTIA